jgi:hypothetical protein
MVVAYLSDKSRKRFPFIVFSFAMALAGVITLFRLDTSKYAQYGALCLYAMGVFGAVPIVICWFVMNLQGHRDRAVGAAWQVAFRKTAGLVSTFSIPGERQAKVSPGLLLGARLSLYVSCG